MKKVLQFNYTQPEKENPLEKKLQEVLENPGLTGRSLIVIYSEDPLTLKNTLKILRKAGFKRLKVCDNSSCIALNSKYGDCIPADLAEGLIYDPDNPPPCIRLGLLDPK